MRRRLVRLADETLRRQRKSPTRYAPRFGGGSRTVSLIDVAQRRAAAAAPPPAPQPPPPAASIAGDRRRLLVAGRQRRLSPTLGVRPAPARAAERAGRTPRASAGAAVDGACTGPRCGVHGLPRRQVERN